MAEWREIVLFMHTFLTLLYHTASQPYEYVGCYTNIWTLYTYDSTVAGCINQCLYRSFSYAGLRKVNNYFTCHCGHYDTLGTADGNRCQFCNSQSSDVCGKWWNYKAVYKRVCEDGKWGRIHYEYHPSGSTLDCGHTCGNCKHGITCDDRTGECPEKQCKAGFLPPNCDHSVMDIRYVGCYVDFEGRALGKTSDQWYSQSAQVQTIQNCINICIYSNSKYAGLVNGGRCFCGNEYDKYGRGSGCSVTCQGNPSEICGGLYRASVYKAECSFGYWGKGQNVCSHLCGTCKDNDHCDINNGNCPAGCAPGWRNKPRCDQKCDNGRFGAGCNDYCNCYGDDGCHPETGVCISRKCAPGYQGTTCSQNCQAGTFGENCTGECHCASDTDCSYTNGYCNGHACQDGWGGDYCQDRACPSGKFGPPTCSGICHCLSDNDCENQNGICNGDCVKGWEGIDCQQKVCEQGYFGKNCKEECHCELPDDCNPKNGSCSGMCQDGWKGGDCQMKLISPGKGITVPLAAGVAAAVVVLLIVVVIGFVVFRLRRKKTKGQSKEGIDNVSKDITEVPAVALVADRPPKMLMKALEEKPVTSTNSLESEIVIDDESQGQDMTYMNNEEVLRMTTVNLKDLQTIVNREKVKQEPFKDEYERLPKGKQAEWQAAVRRGIKDKNRFKNIYPYDHHAVKLTLEDGDPLSDYVNGSYVKDPNGENNVIASQGPTPQSLPDFWRMIWEHDVNIIVMLTNLVEAGKIKCEQYWPDVGTITIGMFDIELTQSMVLPDFVIRCLTVKKGEIHRKVTQLHYISWPDHGVPRVATALLNFRRKVMAEKEKFQTTGLTLIHCSAGIGRTGAYLAIDHLLREAEEKEEVDVFNCVSNLRTYRVNMVQTRAQYNFVYTALLEGIWVGETLIPCFQFHDAYSIMLNPDPYSSSTKLEQQYQLLESLKSNPNSSKYSVALSEKNRSKNRNQAIVPANAAYPILMTRIKGRTEYINGVFVDGRAQRNCFLVTQMPFVDTVVDFWRMVYDYKCPTIIMLNKVEDKNQDVGIYWPISDSPVEHEPFIITLISETQEDGFLVREINIQHKETSRSITQYFFADWPLDGSIGPSSLENLFKMYEHIKISRSRSDLDGPLVVHCLDGVQLSGMYVAISNLCDMMSVEQELDVFHVVQTIRENRPQFITSQEQYRYLYEACGKYMDSYSTYANFQ